VSSDPEKIKERSVDSLQQIYAVVIALAIAQAVESLLKDSAHGALLDLSQVLVGLPAFLALLATLVPFWHGMNRHLDRCYVEKKSAVVEGALLLDFGAFFVEASFLFAAGWMMRSGIHSFIALGGLLLFDSFWGFVSHQIHFPRQKSHVRKWSVINLVAIAIGILVVAFPFGYKPIVLMFVAIGRTIADYLFCGDFYFGDVSNREN
jgi:hypothetical protein